MNTSSLSESYRKAFAKRLKDREVDNVVVPAHMTREEEQAYLDADIAFNARSRMNSTVRGKSAKYRKAYHERRIAAAEGASFLGTSNNAEVRQAWANALESTGQGRVAAIDPEEEEALRKLANVELFPISAVVPAPAPAAAPAPPPSPASTEPPAIGAVAAAAPALPPDAAPAAGMDEEYEREQDKARLQELKNQLERCKEACGTLEKEYKEYLEINEKKKLEGITLPLEAKLIDLLVERILDIDDSWKTKIDTLILIPHSLKGDFLRGGDYFEALFQLAIVIGILPQFRGKYIKMYDIDQYKHLVEKENYLYTKPVRNSGGSEQGVSDITFEVSTKPDFTVSTSSYKCGEKPLPNESALPFYFISVKGYKKEKSLKDAYDIPLLDKQITLFPEKTNKKIVVCVRNKEQFMSRMTRTKIDFLKGFPVIGYDEVMDAFTEFRVNFFNRLSGEKTKEVIKSTIQELFPPSNIQKPMLSLYFHQELITKSTINRIKEEQSKYEKRKTPHFLCIGVLPRGGKSFIAGGIINEHMKYLNKKENYNVLFLTSAITETKKQFREDLVKKFSDFANFEFINVVKPPNTDDIIISDGRGQNNFYFISRQLSSKKEENPEGIGEESIAEANILLSLKRKLGTLPHFDICFFDEAHIGISSKTVKSNFQKVFEEFPGVPIVLMTATYKKPAVILESPKDLFVWDLQDIKDMKSLALLGMEEFKKKQPDIYERFPNLAEHLLLERINNGESLEQISKPYKQFPNPNFINLTFTPEQIQSLVQSGSGYSYDKAFRINKNTDLIMDISKWLEWQNLLVNREDSLRLRQFLTPEADPGDTILLNANRKYRALNQIFAIAQKNSSRPSPLKPFSVIMFLPKLDGQSVGELCCVWASFLNQSKYWRENFVFMTLSPVKYRRTDESLQQQVKRGIVLRDYYQGRDLKDLIEEVEREALYQNKGLVLLSYDVAKMGISLPCVDIVFLMSTETDADDIIQKMYRALTDNPPTKKDGFIVDLDLKRIVTAMFDYDLNKDAMRLKLTTSPTIEERLMKISDLCNWGYDTFIEDNTSKNFDDIMNEIKSRVLNGIRERVFIDNSDKEIEKKQKEFIQSNKGLEGTLIRILLYTKFVKSKRPTKEELSTRGLAIPGEEEKPKAPKVNGEEEKESNNNNSSSTDELRPLNPNFMNELYEKVYNITKTFVNALVIKSAEPWTKSMNISALLEKYKTDKATAGPSPSCECSSNENCKKDHNNLYQAAYCELKSYALNLKEGSQEKYDYDPITHNEIMNSVETIFESAPNIIEWNIYIEKLLMELRSQKGGSMKKKTFKYTRKDGYDHRKKIQQSTRRHR